MIMFSFVIFIMRIVITIINTRWSSLSSFCNCHYHYRHHHFPRYQDEMRRIAQIFRIMRILRSYLKGAAPLIIIKSIKENEYTIGKFKIIRREIRNCYLGFSKTIMQIEFHYIQKNWQQTGWCLSLRWSK